MQEAIVDRIDEVIEALDRSNYVPIWKKSNLTIREASEYSGIGQNKIRELTEDEDCDFVLWIGTKRMIKRQRFEEYVENQYSI